MPIEVASVWSKHFGCYVHGIDGMNVMGDRVVVRLDSGEFVDIPKAWVVPVSPPRMRMNRPGKRDVHVYRPGAPS